jgi:hypothetical protein
MTVTYLGINKPHSKPRKTLDTMDNYPPDMQQWSDPAEDHGLTLQVSVKNGNTYTDILVEDDWTPARFSEEFRGLEPAEYHPSAHGLYCIELLDRGEVVDAFYTYENPAL